MCQTSIILSPKSPNHFAHYLAGIIESDGSVIVASEKASDYQPYIEISFHIADIALAEMIQQKQNIGGRLSISKNYCKLTIKKRDEVLLVICLINGKMRTPKIEALHRLIIWYNSHYDGQIPLLPLDNSPIQANS